MSPNGSPTKSRLLPSKGAVAREDMLKIASVRAHVAGLEKIRNGGDIQRPRLAASETSRIFAIQQWPLQAPKHIAERPISTIANVDISQSSSDLAHRTRRSEPSDAVSTAAAGQELSLVAFLLDPHGWV